MSTENSQKRVVVTGDVTIDWNLAYHRRNVKDPKASWTPEDEGRLHWQRGGAALLADLIGELPCVGNNGYSLGRVEAPQPNDPFSFDKEKYNRYNHSFALWEPADPDPKYYGDHGRWRLPPNNKVGTSPADANRRVWRVRDFLGFHKATPTLCSNLPNACNADLIVVDDAGYDSYTLDESSLNTVRWVVLKISGDLQQSNKRPALKKVVGVCPQKTLAILNIDALRSVGGVQISRGLSWECTAEDVRRELENNEHLKLLRKCRHVVVSLNTSGAVLMSHLPGFTPRGESRVFKLFYDPRCLEGTWERPNSGQMMGYTTILTASLGHQIMIHPDMKSCNYDDHIDILQAGIKAGIAAMRELFLCGYICVDCPPESPYAYQNEQNSHPPALVFPAAQVATYFNMLTTENVPENENNRIGCKYIKTTSGWSILEDFATSKDCTIQLARTIVQHGFGSAQNTADIPSLEIGKLRVVDRREIEALRSIKKLIVDYNDDRTNSRPLNLAVFGPPGAGKSFAVQQLAESTLGVSPFGGRAKTPSLNALTFNVSQFCNVDDFYGALHQVRDVGLSGLLPVVFWDEFDTRVSNTVLGWLRYFLAPMLDGEFMQHEVTHSIGRCIFVFAGGTFKSMKEVDKFALDEPVIAQNAKLPDFISRLQGSLDVLGINPPDSGGDNGASGHSRGYVIRRAVLLRDLLYQHGPDLFPDAHPASEVVSGHDSRGDLVIDEGLLAAFLRIKEYKHNNRSLGAIIRASALPGKNKFQRSDLPANTVLDLHVDTKEFLNILRQHPDGTSA